MPGIVSPARRIPPHDDKAPSSGKTGRMPAALPSSAEWATLFRMQHDRRILSRLFFAMTAERHWRSHL